MDSAGFEPASATLTECRVPFTPRALMQCERRNRSARKDPWHKVLYSFPKRDTCFDRWNGRLVGRFSAVAYVGASARTRLFTAAGSVSQAVRNTKRGERPRIFIRYRTVRLASNLAVSRSSQPSPFCTMSSSSVRSESESFVISGKNIFARAPRISATHAALRCQRFEDFDQRKT